MRADPRSFLSHPPLACRSPGQESVLGVGEESEKGTKQEHREERWGFASSCFASWCHSEALTISLLHVSQPLPSVPLFAGPQEHEGESHYQYLMRKKREAAEEEQYRKEEDRMERERLREEKMIEDMEYRQRLEEEHGPRNEEEQYSDEEG